MRKMREKSNANPVGANCIRPHFEGRTKNNQKGITLIALIITIIVMLILVGVTINIALNGGLFSKAKDAAKETEQKSILEQIILLAEWNNDGKIKVKATVDNVIEEFGADKVTTNPSAVTSNTTEVIVTIAGKHGSYNYKITTREISEGEGSGPQKYNEYYFTFNMIDGIEQKMIDYNVDEETGASSSMIMVSATDFWEAVGTDLSGQYSISIENFSKVNPDNLIIPDNTSEFTEVYSGSEVTEANNIFAFAEQDGYVTIVLSENPGEEIDFVNQTNTKGIVSVDGDPANNVLSWTEFLTLYGEIKFSFKGTENKPDTDYYGYYKTDGTLGNVTISMGYYISEKNYYVGDVYAKMQGGESSGGYGYDLGNCSVCTIMSTSDIYTPNMFGYIEKEYIALLEDGTSKKYENAIFIINGDKEKVFHYLIGYLKYENNKYKLVLIQPEYSEEETNIGEDKKVIKYASLEEVGTLKKSFLPNYNYDQVYESDTSDGFKYLIYRNTADNTWRRGYMVLGREFWVSYDNYEIKYNYVAKLSDGIEKEYERALFSNARFSGYIKDDNTIVKVEATGAGNYVNGYPTTFDSIREFSVYTKR